MAKNDAISAICVAFILPIAEAFLAKHSDWSPTRLSKEAVKDPGKLALMRNGMVVRPETARKILAVIRKVDADVVNDFLKAKKLLPETTNA